MALAFVLSTVALLAILVGSLSAASQAQIALARNQLETARARALADGGIAIALAALADADPRTGGAGTRVIRMTGGEVRLVVEDEGGKVDLNTAPIALLEDLFVAAGASRRTAESLAEGIRSRRASIGTPAGARPGRSLAANRAFTLVDELAQLPGMTAPLLARIADATTVVSGSEIVDPSTAPPVALLALSGMDAGRSEGFMRERERLGRQATLAAPLAGTLIGSGYTVTAAAATEGGGRFVRVTVVKPLPFAGRFNLRLADWRGGEEGLP